MTAAAAIAVFSEGMGMAYDGGKAQAGVFQWIINHIPPHSVYVELCLGDGAVLRAKRPAEQTIGVEIDPAVIAERWRGDEVPNLSLRCEAALDFIAGYTWQGHEFVYCDPPYLVQTRSHKRAIYRYEMMEIEQHRALLQVLRRLPCMVAVSSYWSPLYELELAGWRLDTLQTTRRSGQAAIEHLWMNYPEPYELHDYDYLGTTYRERERIKRKRQRWKDRLRTMPALERHALLATIEEVRNELSAGQLADGTATNDDGAGALASIATNGDAPGAGACARGVPSNGDTLAGQLAPRSSARPGRAPASSPAYADFDIYQVGISGGKDSTGVALWTWYEAGLPRERIRITFCDTENEDALTYAFIDLLRQHMPIEVIKPERGFYDLARSKKRFPSTKARFCTQYLKVIPTREYVLVLQRAGCTVVRFDGVRRQEGHNTNNRGAVESWEFHEGDFVWVHHPLLSYSLDQVWELHRRYLSLDAVCGIVDDDPTMKDEHKAQLIRSLRAHGIPRNPLYDMGASRVGCFPCINSRKAEVRALSTFRPERVEFIAQKELWVGEVNAGISTFFPRGYIPLHLNSKTVEINGNRYDVPTIYDVVKWSHTKRGGREYEQANGVSPASACDIGGMCE